MLMTIVVLACSVLAPGAGGCPLFVPVFERMLRARLYKRELGSGCVQFPQRETRGLVSRFPGRLVAGSKYCDASLLHRPLMEEVACAMERDVDLHHLNYAFPLPVYDRHASPGSKRVGLCRARGAPSCPCWSW